MCKDTSEATALLVMNGSLSAQTLYMPVKAKDQKVVRKKLRKRTMNFSVGHL